MRPFYQRSKPEPNELTDFLSSLHSFLMQEEYKLDIYEKDAGKPGPILVVTGAVHGTEPCGPAAINKVMSLMAAGQVELVKGRIIFVPVSNPLAFVEGVRYVNRDLNRFLYERDEPQIYEDYIGNALCSVLKRADYLIDLHSYTGEGPPLVFLKGKDVQEVRFAQATRIPSLIHGWQEAFNNHGINEESQGTTEFTRLHGGRSVTIECGQHKNPYSEAVGIRAILGVLDYLGLAKITDSVRHEYLRALPTDGEAICVRMTERFFKAADGYFAQAWKTLSAVNKGQVLAHYHNGETVQAPESGYLIFPAESHRDWLYFGVPSFFPKPAGP